MHMCIGVLDHGWVCGGLYTFPVGKLGGDSFASGLSGSVAEA